MNILNSIAILYSNFDSLILSIYPNSFFVKRFFKSPSKSTFIGLRESDSQQGPKEYSYI